MKIWVLTAVFLYSIGSQAYSFKSNTPCILCNTVIRCGDGVDDVIRPPNSSKMITVAQYCARQSNDRDSKYLAIRSVFNNKTRFSYEEYQKKAALLAEKKIAVEAKPLIHSTNLVNTTNTNDLQNYTDYVLEVLDPKNDKNLEVQKDGKLVTKLDAQPQALKKDYKERNTRIPSSERELRGNNAWITPEQPGVINPLDDSSKKKNTRRAITPTPTPYETTRIIIEDSF
ncbi:MAG: hypothetical protein KDD37_02465, partial [Bdellovibrionales bacterium]|nr:hypothetical protein [Bdellovibrionales bacterium]